MKNTSEAILNRLIERYPLLENCKFEIFRAAQELITCYQRDGKLLVCGNGGSAADSEHIVGELMKEFALPRKLSEKTKKEFYRMFGDEAEYLCSNLQYALPAISLVSETALATAYSNDNASDLYFAQQVWGHGKSGDIFLGITTSGNSKNVIYATKVAQFKHMVTIALTGRSGGKIKEIVDIAIVVPEEETYRIQEYHLPIYHALCAAVENEFFGSGM
ncbi:MAG: SIS domain-containing protein [Lachnospiraceae bacterium]|nr:SIS domain-containing protein [Lachnospiraceae bacterium]